MSIPPLVVPLLLAAAFAGCTTPTTPGTASDATIPVELALEATGCQIVGFVFLVEPDHAQGLLPAGFVPRDAQALVGAPAPTGRAVLLVESYQCEDHSWADGPIGALEVSILVEAPDVPGERAPAPFDFYQPLMGAPAPALDEMERLHWDHIEVDASVDVTALPSGSATADASVQSQEDALVTGRVAAPAPSTLAGPARFWQVHNEGTTFIDYDIEMPIAAGAAECTIKGAVADALRVTTCAPGDAIGMIAPAVSFTAVGRFMPGVQPNTA